ASARACVSSARLSTEITVIANSDNEYWVDVRVNGVLLRAQIDTGMTQSACEIGLGLTTSDFDRLAPSLQGQNLVQLHIANQPSSSAAPFGTGRVSIEGLDG